MKTDADGPQQNSRAPVLWLLVPAASGIALSRILPLSHPLLFCLAGLLCTAAALWLNRTAPTARIRSGSAASTAVVCSAFLLAWAYGSIRLPDRLLWLAPLPRREVTMEMRVDRAFPIDKWGRSRGLATVVNAPPIQNYLKGERVLYRINHANGIAAPEGATLRIKGLIQRTDPDKGSKDPASFDAWLERGGVVLELTRARILEETSPPSPVERTGAAFRTWATENLLAGSEKEPETRAMVPAMLLGQKRLLSPEDKAAFRHTGMMHLFAVSGLHVGLVALTLEGALALLRIGRRPRILCGLAALLGYVIMIGSPPSAVRAFIMIGVHRAGALMGRPSKGLSALATSALVVLLWNPAQLFDIGAQLSYGIVAGILLYGVPMGRLLIDRMPLYADLPPQDLRPWQKGMLHARDWLCEGFGAGLGAFLISTPLSIQYFGIFAPGSMVLTLLMTPVALLCVVAALLSLAASGIALVPGLPAVAHAGEFLNHAAWLCTWEMQAVTDAAARVPVFSGELTFPAPWAGSLVALVMLILMVLLRGSGVRARLRWQAAPVATLLALTALCAAVG